MENLTTPKLIKRLILMLVDGLEGTENYNNLLKLVESRVSK